MHKTKVTHKYHTDKKPYTKKHTTRTQKTRKIHTAETKEKELTYNKKTIVSTLSTHLLLLLIFIK